MSDTTNVNIEGNNNETNIVVDASTCIIKITEQLVAGPVGLPGPVSLESKKFSSNPLIYYYSDDYTFDLVDIKEQVINTLLDNSETSSIKYLLLLIGGSEYPESYELIRKANLLSCKYKELFCINIQKELSNLENTSSINYRNIIFKENNMKTLLIKNKGIHPLTNEEFNNNYTIFQLNEQIFNFGNDIPGLCLFNLVEHKYYKDYSTNLSNSISINDVDIIMSIEKFENIIEIVYNSFDIIAQYIGHKVSTVNILPYDNFIEVSNLNLPINILNNINKKTFIRIDEHIDNLGKTLDNQINNTRLSTFKQSLINKINVLGYYNYLTVESCEEIKNEDDVIVSIKVNVVVRSL